MGYLFCPELEFFGRPAPGGSGREKGGAGDLFIPYIYDIFLRVRSMNKPMTLSGHGATPTCPTLTNAHSLLLSTLVCISMYVCTRVCETCDVVMSTFAAVCLC